MRAYRHLSLEEREKFYGLKQKGLSLRDIAKKLGRSHATLSKELKRNTKYGKKYLPCYDQKRAERIGNRQRYKAPLKDPEIFTYVRDKLRESWSPETIAGRIKIDRPELSIHHETVYRYIYSKQAKRYELWKHLVLHRKKRMKKNGRRVKRQGKIPNAVSIDLRPKVVDRRKQLGHWETDNMEGKKSDQSVVSATTERTTRYIILSKMNSRKATDKTNALIERMKNLPEETKRTITADNGKENAYHEEISKTLNLKMYFCHAYHSWEKGTVENSIGRTRRYIPKGMSIDPIAEEQISRAEFKLNNTPRKCLNYLKPYEKMEELLKENCPALLSVSANTF